MCPEARVKEEGLSVVVVVVVRNWLGSCVCLRTGSPGLTVLFCAVWTVESIKYIKSFLIASNLSKFMPSYSGFQPSVRV